MTRGRKRKFNPNIPAHINQDKLPDGCYWNNRDSYWFTFYLKPNGKKGRRRIAGSDALMSDLHRLMELEAGIDRDVFAYLADKYFKSESFKALANQRNYENAYKTVCTYQTKLKKTLDQVPIKLWTDGLVQIVIDTIGQTRGPTAARLVNSFIRRVFAWNLKRDNCNRNPALGTELPEERKKQTYPSHRAYYALLNFAKQNGTYGYKSKTSCPHYIWQIMELEYLCRQRGIETRTMTDADIDDIGVTTVRAKGSKTNITEWNDRLRAVVESAQVTRKAIYKDRNRPTPLKASDRPLIVNTLGEPLKTAAYHSAWQRFITKALKLGIIQNSERFSLHDLKRKGITDTKGDKQKASGHHDPKMLAIYDKSIDRVKPSSE